MHSYLRWVRGETKQVAVPDERRIEKVRSWRRRVLLRRGARMHAAMGLDAGNCSLAMLDEAGVVVSWYGPQDHAAEHVVNRHVSQFYLPEEIVSKQPLRDLHAATVEGSNTREGWRRRADGTTFWGTTVIKAVVLRDGRLQGFSYVTSACDGPSADVPVTRKLGVPEDENEAVRSDMFALRLLPQRDRMVRSRAAARQRRLFRLAGRIRAAEHAQIRGSVSAIAMTAVSRIRH